MRQRRLGKSKDYLYLAQPKRGTFKIGVSASVQERVQEQGYALLREWYLPTEARLAESLVSALMCNAGLQRGHRDREFFRCNRATIDAAIDCAFVIMAGKTPRDVLKAIHQIEITQAVQEVA